MLYHAALYFCPVAFSVLVFFSLSIVTKCLTRSMIEKHRCLRLFVVVFEVELLTSTSIYPLSSSLICTPHHPSPGLSNQINLSPSVGQSHHIQTSRRGEEGDWRRRDHLRDISLSDGQPSWSITRSGEKVTGLLPLVSYLSWILFMTAGP